MGLMMARSAGRRRWCKVVVAAMVMMMVVVTVVTSYRQRYSEYLLRSLEGPLPADDPALLQYLRDQVLVSPSAEPFRPGPRMVVDISNPSENFYEDSLRRLFQDERGGFFVEAGALDGESMSNSLWLERQRGWTGLLVEADTTAFTALTHKRRRAWAANVCLAPNPFPAKMLFSQSSHAPGPLSKPLGFKMRAMNGLAQYVPERSLDDSWFKRVQCVPLQSLLVALGVTQVDLLVLDVEGAERAILDHLDLDRFNVQVLCLEWKKLSEQQAVVERLVERGFQLAARMKEDLVLVRQGSEYAAHLTTTTTTLQGQAERGTK